MANADDEIRIRPLSKEELEKEIDTTTGLSNNGTTHDAVQPIKGGGMLHHRFYLDSGQELPEKYKRMLVENEEDNVALVPQEDRDKMRARIAEFRRELADRPK